MIPISRTSELIDSILKESAKLLDWTKSLTRHDIDVPNWQKVMNVSRDARSLTIEVFDTTQNEEYTFVLETDGTLWTGGGFSNYNYPKKITNKDELETALSEWSDDVRGHSDIWVEDEG